MAYCMCPHTTVLCPHTTIFVSSCYCICLHTTTIYVSEYYYMCRHAATSAENCRAHGFERVYAPEEAESAAGGSSASGLEGWANAVLQAMSQNKL